MSEPTPRQTVMEPGQVRIIGNVDHCDATLVAGWACALDLPQVALELDVCLDDKVLGRVRADQYRKDLDKPALHGGRCAFRFPVPVPISEAEASRLKLRLADSTVYLLPPPRQPAGPAAGREPAAVPVAQTWGLWLDRADWLDTMDRKLAAGDIDDVLAEQLFRFKRDGYVVLHGAVSAQVVEGINRDVERFWIDPPDGMRVETFEPDGVCRYVPPAADLRDGRTKLLDIYAFSSAARLAIAAAPISRFLSAVFEGRPKAFQSLTFWKGSQQAIHKDTAYVRIDENPLALVASWIALEDIGPGTGELEYYVGSHRDPHFLFDGFSKWMTATPGEHDRFLHALHEDARRFGRRRTSFLPKAGDVLLWHADLAHGGSRITQPGRTRRSLVTHYTADGYRAFYERLLAHRPFPTPACQFLSQYADVCA